MYDTLMQPQIDFQDMTPKEYLSWIGPAVAVENGWKWLSENFPGWPEHIDPTTLDLAYGRYCICGQVFSEDAVQAGDSDGYTWAGRTLFNDGVEWLETLFPSIHDDYEFEWSNFASLLGFDTDGTYYNFAVLRKAWIRRLAVDSDGQAVDADEQAVEQGAQ